MTMFYAFTMIAMGIIMALFLIRFQDKKVNYYILVVLLLMSISNAGYFLLSIADTLQEAFLAKKITYLGGCFIPPVMLFLIFKTCNIRINKYLRSFLILYSFFVYILTLSIGIFNIYYKSSYLVLIKGATVVISEYGFARIFFVLLLYGYLFAGLVILGYTYKKKKQISYKNIVILTVFELINIAIFICLRNNRFHIEVFPIIYVIDGLVLLYLRRRVTLYSLEDNIISSLGKKDIYGYIMFDKRRNYLGANALAMKIFPELFFCRVDSPIVKRPELDILQKELDKFESDGDILFELDQGEEHYEGHIKRIWYADKDVGYLFEIKNATDRYKYTKLLAKYNDELVSEIDEKTAHIRKMQAKLLVSMADIIENRDGNTGGHIKRTSHVIKILLDTMKEDDSFALEESFCQAIIKSAPMHDLGKIAIDDSILRKPGRLTEEEFAIMQTHAAKSAELVENILTNIEEPEFVKVAKNIACYHHEKWNGTGYPEKLKGEEIPLEARIMAIADVYDALVSKRCYKESMSFEQAYQVMKDSMGSHFDPRLDAIFEKSREKLEQYYSS